MKSIKKRLLSTIPAICTGLISGVLSAQTLNIPSTEAALCKQVNWPAAPNVTDNGICGTSGNRFGAQIAVGRAGDIIYQESVGSATFDGNTKVQNNHMFRIASITKPITAIGIMKLIEDDQLHWDDTVFGASGILNDADITAQIQPGSLITDITVDHLLKQTSGWDPDLSGVTFSLRQDKFSDAPLGISYLFDEQNRASLRTILKYIARQSPVVPPGASYDYNNANSVVLKSIIEKVSGQRYEDYLKSAVFDKLNIEEIKPAKTFRADRYTNEVEHLWPSLTNPGNIMPSYCNGEDVPAQYGGFRHEGTWIASARALTKLFMSLDAGLSDGQQALEDETIEDMFDIDELPSQDDYALWLADNTDPDVDMVRTARGWANINNGNDGVWSFSGGMAGSHSRFAKLQDSSFGDVYVTYLRNARITKNDTPDPEIWNIRELTSALDDELETSYTSTQLDAIPPANVSENDSEWKPSTISPADIAAGCHSYLVSPFVY